MELFISIEEIQEPSISKFGLILSGFSFPCKEKDAMHFTLTSILAKA